MIIINKLESLLNKHKYEDNEPFLKEKITTVNIIIITLVLIISVFTFLRYIRAEYVQAIADLVLVISFVIGFYFLRKDKKYFRNVSRILIFIAASVALVLVVQMPDIDTRFAWTYIVTYMMFYLLDYKEGRFWFLGLFVTMNILFFSGMMEISVLAFGTLLTTMLFLAFFLIRYESMKQASENYLLNYTQKLKETVDEKVFELKEQKETFESLFQQSYDGILLIEDKKFIKCNDAIIDMFGCADTEEFLALDILDISSTYQENIEPSKEKIKIMLDICLKNGSHNFEWLSKKVYGKEFWSDVTLTHLKLHDKDVIHAVVRDISDKKALEEENKKIYDNLEEEVQKRTKELEIAMGAKDDFLANMSHEIRTPLNAILGFITILRKSEKSEKKLKYFDIINTSGQSLLRIINDILDFSKIQSRKLELEKSQFSILRTLEDIHALFGEKAKEKSIEFHLNIKSQLPEYVLGDLVRVKQVISNIVSNAIKFTPENGTIDIDVSYDFTNSCVLCSVSDTGIGIDEKYAKNIFNSFSQADSSTTRKFGGTGLGLSISKDLVELMGGSIELQSVVDKGSKFSFTFHLESIGNDKVSLVKDEKESEKFFNTDTKILVVEDNKTNQMLIKMLLRDLDLECDIVGNGVEAVEAVKTKSYDIVLMDENMPLMSGMEATKHIRELGFIDTPIVAVTANALKGDKDKFIASGMDDYVSKPIDNDELIKVLKKYID